MRRRIRSKVAVRFAISQRESEKCERLKMSFKHWSERGNFGSLIRSLQLNTCESRFAKKKQKKCFEDNFSEKAIASTAKIFT
jgi:hypothetical protein